MTYTRPRRTVCPFNSPCFYLLSLLDALYLPRRVAPNMTLLQVPYTQSGDNDLPLSAFWHERVPATPPAVPHVERRRSHPNQLSSAIRALLRHSQPTVGGCPLTIVPRYKNSEETYTTEGLVV